MSRRLIFGTQSRSRLRVLSPIGVVDGREVFPIAGAEDDDPANSGDDDDNSDDSDDSDDDEDDDSKSKSKTTTRRHSRTRGSDYNALRRERNQLLKEKQDREAKDRENELKGKSEVERANAEREDAVKARDSLTEENAALKMELAIVRASTSAKSKFQWADIEDVLNDKTLRNAIEVDDDGELTGVDEALKDLAKRKPHFLVKSGEDDDGKNKDNRNGRQQQQQPAGSTGGQPSGNGNGDVRAADRQRLNTLYPALQRLPQ